VSNSCDICKHLNSEDVILATKYWVVNLSRDQAYLGRSYVLLREHKPSLSSLSTEEWTEYIDIVRILERSCFEAFGARPFNWSCLMNNSYQLKRASPHVHWHFRPRYKNPVTLNGTTFSDPEFGFHYDRTLKSKIDNATFQIILKTLRSSIQAHQ